jgi:UDP-GlcNAc:undecaprenyl-phosphate GlcNAc-1-phosphate transferase
MDPLDLALPLTVAFGLALVLTPVAGRLALGAGVVDRPTARGINQRSDMPLLGGLAVAAAFFCAVGSTHHGSAASEDFARWVGLVTGGLVLVAAGAWDDRYGMGAPVKLLVQGLAAVIAIYSGFEISRIGNPYTMTIVELPRAVVWPASILWIIGVTNALNLLDGLDGLAAGVGTIIGATLTVIAWQAGQPFGVCIGLALVGSLLGFLPHNFPPARIFLGDTGSMFIGFTLSLLALEGYRRVSLITFLVPLLALAVPILDTALSVFRRVRLRAPIFSADRLHMHHRLLEAEGSTRGAVLQFYIVTIAFCLIALSFTKLHGLSAVIFLVAVIALTLRLLWNMGALDMKRGEDDETREESA